MHASAEADVTPDGPKQGRGERTGGGIRLRGADGAVKVKGKI